MMRVIEYNHVPMVQAAREATSLEMAVRARRGANISSEVKTNVRR